GNVAATVTGNLLAPDGIVPRVVASAQAVAQQPVACPSIMLSTGGSPPPALQGVVALAHAAAHRLATISKNPAPLAGIPAPSTVLSNLIQWLDQLLALLTEGTGRLADLARYWIARLADVISSWTARIKDLADFWFYRSVPLARSWLQKVNVRVAAIQ